MTALATTVEVELACPNDGCPSYDVDRGAGQLARVLRPQWSARALEYADDSLVPCEDERCPECGTRGEIVE